jgi:hypothetical protein
MPGGVVYSIGKRYILWTEIRFFEEIGFLDKPKKVKKKLNN